MAAGFLVVFRFLLLSTAGCLAVAMPVAEAKLRPSACGRRDIIMKKMMMMIILVFARQDGPALLSWPQTRVVYLFWREPGIFKCCTCM